MLEYFSSHSRCNKATFCCYLFIRKFKRRYKKSSPSSLATYRISQHWDSFRWMCFSLWSLWMSASYVIIWCCWKLSTYNTFYINGIHKLLGSCFYVVKVIIYQLSNIRETAKLCILKLFMEISFVMNLVP